ncbi:MAG: GxxExxY protein [Bacteroidia bacterium]
MERLTQKYVNEIAFKIIGCAIEVHKHLGPGLLESVYESCFIEEMIDSGLSVHSQVIVPIYYEGKNLGNNLKLDILVNDLIIVEEKVVEQIIPIHRAQLLSYLKLAGKPKGLLINFHSDTIKSEMVSMVTDEFAKLPRE